MEFRFEAQNVPAHITTSDVIELYNCEDQSLNGMWIVADVEDMMGEVTLVGASEHVAGMVTVICLSNDEDGSDVD